MGQNRKISNTLALALSLLFVAPLCNAQSNAPAAGGEIAIGALVPLTGAGSQFGPLMEQAIRLAASEVNEAGPPLGRKLKVFAEDGQTSPDAAVRAAQKLINVNRVKAIVGTWSSAVTLAVAPIAIQSNVIHMHTSGANAITDLNSNGLVWRFQPPARYTGAAVAAAAKVAGWKTAATAARNDPSGVSTVESFTKKFEADGGKVLANLTYPASQTSYSAEVRTLGQANADFVFNSTYAPELTVMAKNASTSGAKINWLAPGWAVNQAFINAVGPEVANGVWAVDSAPNVDSKGYAGFMSAFTKTTGKTLAPSDTYVFSAYDMVIVLSLAMVDCGCESGKALSASILKVAGPGGTEVTNYADGYKALKAGNKINYQGASSNLDFNDKGDQIPMFGLYKVVNGKVALQSVFKVQE